MIVVPIREIKAPQAKIIEPSAVSEELIVACPTCKAIQTVWFTGDRMLPTRKFRQENGKVYHDCGSTLPCRIYKS